MQPGTTWWQVRLAEGQEIKRDHVGEVTAWKELVARHPDIESLQDRLATAYENSMT